MDYLDGEGADGRGRRLSQQRRQYRGTIFHLRLLALLQYWIQRPHLQ